MYHVICCNGYYTVASTNVRKDAMRICMTHKDGDFVNINTGTVEAIQEMIEETFVADVADGKVDVELEATIRP